MSVHRHRESTYRCAYCDDEIEHTVAGSYCSERCHTAHKGQKALNNIRHDHRFCSTCFRPLKVVYRPDDADCPELRKKALIIRESFQGFQDFTEHAESGNHGIECVCGNVDHYHSEDTLREGEPFEWFLKLAFETFRKEGQVDYTFDTETFADQYWQHNDFEHAVGAAIQ